MTITDEMDWEDVVEVADSRLVSWYFKVLKNNPPSITMALLVGINNPTGYDKRCKPREDFR